MKTKQNPIVNYVGIPLIYHLLFWLVYTVFWHSIFSPDFLSLGGFTTSLIYTLVHALVSYFSIYVLVPRLWKRGRRLVYILALVASILVGACLLAFLLYLWFEGVSPATRKLFFADWQMLVGSLLGSTFSGVTLAMVIYLLLQRRQLEQQQERLQQEKMAAELQFLRSQLDPHFLFNALNNIYFLIKKDPDAAAEALSGFSDLLRYQIYQGREDRIPLTEEFSYLRRYADLAALRLPENAKVHVDLATSNGEHAIAPLLLLPLVENAFKHVDKEQTEVIIQGQVIENELHFSVQNTCLPMVEKLVEADMESGLSSSRMASGIGLDNLRQRLELIYPGNTNYIAWQEDNRYQAKLKIQLA